MDHIFVFPKIESPNSFIFNQILQNFYNLGLVGTLRENIQNAIDAKLPTSNKPVHLIINISQIKSTEIPGIQSLREHIYSLESHNDYVNEKIETMKQYIQKDLVNIITIEDQNTQGLSHVQSNGSVSSYNAYAYAKGVHKSQQDEHYASGGSHGVGKISNNALSEVNLMYFANCDEQGKQTLGGSIELMHHTIDNQAYDASGSFAQADRSNHSFQFIPYENKSIHPIFQKTTRGLKNIIPFVKDEYVEQDQYVRLLLNNFFYAFHTHQLTVDIQKNGHTEVKIHKDNLIHLSKNPRYFQQNYSEMSKEDIKNNLAPLYIQTLTETEPRDLEVNVHRGEIFNFKLYLNHNVDVRYGFTGIIRGMGMIIENREIRRNKLRSYNAVLIGGQKEDQYLKTLENQSHTELETASITNEESQKKAKRFLNTLDRELERFIRENDLIGSEDTDIIDTGNIFQTVENHFKRSKPSPSRTVKIEGVDVNVGINPDGNRELRPGKTNQKQSIKSPEGTHGPRIVNIINEDKVGNQGHPDKNSHVLKSDNVYVQRVVTDQQTEYLSFDIQSKNTIHDGSSYTLQLKIIDGEGKVHSIENYQDLFCEVINRHNGIAAKILTDKIEGLIVYDSKIELKITFSQYYNPNYKFNYTLRS